MPRFPRKSTKMRVIIRGVFERPEGRIAMASILRPFEVGGLRGLKPIYDEEIKRLWEDEWN
jgi:hypothetical protein